MTLKIAKAVLAASALALAVSGAYAKEDRIGPGDKDDPGFNALDKDNDGSLSRAEAAANPDLARQFKAADRNGDGKLSRLEYLAVMTKKDLNTARERIGAGTRGDKDDPGFNALDKDNDGFVTRSEAAANPDLMRNFKAADKNGDGKLNRAEYLAEMTKKDANAARNTAKRKTDDTANRDRDRDRDRERTPSAGATR